MERATKAIRRSGVRLRSLSSGHGDLQMVISQLGEVRTTFKAFALAQATAAEDLLRWASGGSGGGGQENRAVEETFAHLAELSMLWTEVQKDFADQLKEYRTQYELILEGERHVTHAREVLSLREQREGKLRRDLKRASKKAPVDEVCMLKEKLGQAERSRDLAHLDVVERTGENEAVKMIRVKEGLLKLGAAYCELAHKCLVIFTAHRNIAEQLPDVHDRDLHGIKYTGAGSAMRCVQDAKESVRSFRRSSTSPPKPPPPHPSEPPPPYTPTAPTHPHPPSLPDGHTPTAGPHANSTSNLAEDTSTLPRTLNSTERPGFTETAFRHDTSTSSPELACPPHPTAQPPHPTAHTPHLIAQAPHLTEHPSHLTARTPHPTEHPSYPTAHPSHPTAHPSYPTAQVPHPKAQAPTPPQHPYNPCYEWLPGRGGTATGHGEHGMTRQISAADTRELEQGMTEATNGLNAWTEGTDRGSDTTHQPYSDPRTPVHSMDQGSGRQANVSTRGLTQELANGMDEYNAQMEGTDRGSGTTHYPYSDPRNPVNCPSSVGQDTRRQVNSSTGRQPSMDSPPPAVNGFPDSPAYPPASAVHPPASVRPRAGRNPFWDSEEEDEEEEAGVGNLSGALRKTSIR